MTNRRWLWISLFILILIVIVALVLFWRLVTPQAPGPFYSPSPDEIDLVGVSPGTLLASEPIQENVPDGALGWRILYASTDKDGTPILVSGVVAAPAVLADAPRPVLAFAQGTIGNLPQCGIGHTATPFAAIPEIDAMIAQGFVVVATDYPGRSTPGVHPYLIGKAEAAAVLDSIRAARQMDTAAGEQFVLWGRSQGGQSAFWAAIEAETYAPELDLVAVAGSAPAIQLEDILRANLETQTGSVVIAYALSAWSHHYPEVFNLDTLIEPAYRQQFDAISNTCLTAPVGFLLAGGLPKANDYLATDPFADTAIMEVTNANVPSAPIDVPMLITHGIEDSLIPVETSEMVFQARCADGEDITFVRYPQTDHDSSEQAGLFVIGWLEDRLEGRATGSNCEPS